MIILFAATPLPDDVLLMVLGMVEYSLLEAILACFVGKIILCVGIVFLVRYGKETEIGQMIMAAYGIGGEENPWIIAINLIITIVAVILLIMVDWPKYIKSLRRKISPVKEEIEAIEEEKIEAIEEEKIEAIEEEKIEVIPPHTIEQFAKVLNDQFERLVSQKRFSKTKMVPLSTIQPAIMKELEQLELNTDLVNEYIIETHEMAGLELVPKSVKKASSKEKEVGIPTDDEDYIYTHLRRKPTE